MVIVTKLIWTVEFYAGPGQGIFGEEAQNYHDQAGCMPRHG